MKLYRRKGKSKVVDVALFILSECETSGMLHGYRWMHQRCQENGFTVDKETVRILLGIVDPQGVKRRSKRRLQRRRYFSSGPNAVWHIDGYDKLKPYGICIHGCIDGFSRNIIWLHAWNTNNNPKLVASYFIDAVSIYQGCPERIRSDAGTENASVEHMQYLLRNDHVDRYSGRLSYLYGSSTTNQKIESWWGILRKHCIQHWMDLFSHLKHDGYFTGDFLDKNLIQFCFLETIENEIQDVAHTWNFHHIRASKNNPGPHGKLAVMHAMPALYGVVDCIKQVSPDAIEICKQETTPRCEVCCDATVFELCKIIMDEMRWEFPEKREDLCDLYIALRKEIKRQLT